MKTKKLLLGLSIALFTAMSASAAITRVWTDNQGRKVEATFIKLEGGTVYIQLLDGTVFPLPLDRLSAPDQELAKKYPPSENAASMMSMPANASVAFAAAKIDQLVEAGITRANPKLAEIHKKEAERLAKEGRQAGPFIPVKPNAMLSDEQFVRRVYLDIGGRIPSYDETTAFLKDTAADKRGKLIDKLLVSDGYSSNLFNYFAEMLRITDRFENAQLVRGTPYVQWVKQQFATNRPYDQVVYEMLTAKGKIWQNGATGYLLRDSGMPLDNLANTLTVFLGTDVACAQCHDHPFADWTQRQFYEMASFFGGTTTRMNNRSFPDGKDPGNRLKEEIDAIMKERNIVYAEDSNERQQFEQGINDILNANRRVVGDVASNNTKLPFDYKYPDASPNQVVHPKFIQWNEGDLATPAYVLGESIAGTQNGTMAGNVENLRDGFAKWATHPGNPRFAMTIANRMWERAFGKALTPTVRNIDDPNEAYNPELLKHLASEMVRVKFDLRAFMRIVYNTKTYQREATTAELPMGMAYYFQGPVLRRMSAEQAWDSYITLVLGNPDTVKNNAADLYGRAIDMDLTNPKLTGATVLQKLSAVRGLGATENRMTMGGTLAEANKEKEKDAKKAPRRASFMMTDEDQMAEDESPENAKIVRFGNMKLMRASELEQPAPGGHFLRSFGQSERVLIDGGSKEGSVPQVLMMMNGAAQTMLTSKDSLIFNNMNKVKSPTEKVDAIFLSILNRKPTMREKDIAKRQLETNGENGFGNMIWALINTREFSFIQ